MLKTFQITDYSDGQTYYMTVFLDNKARIVSIREFYDCAGAYHMSIPLNTMSDSQKIDCILSWIKNKETNEKK